MGKPIDLTGRVFGKLLVIERIASHSYPSGSKRRNWLCLCDCGRYTEVLSNALLQGDTKSCGCYAVESRREIGKKNLDDLAGKVFGKLRVISLHSRKTNGTFWLCVCQCGKEIITRAISLKQGDTRSCGCLQKEGLIKRESKIAKELKEYCRNKWNAIDEYKECINPDTKRFLPYDIYIPVFRLYIEVMGDQHYNDNNWFGKRDDFSKRVKKDKLKKKYAKSKGSYLEIDLRKVLTTDDAIKIVEKEISKWNY